MHHSMNIISFYCAIYIFSHKTFIVGKIIILQYFFDNVQYIHSINKYSLNISWFNLCSLFMGLIIQHVLMMMKLI
jgi:hypothetical protein